MNSVSPSPRPPVAPSFSAAPAVQVKICGITTPGDACLCVEAGAHAIGLVFHRRSTRCVTLGQAAAIARAVPDGFPLVGVFVGAAESEIRHAAEKLGLSAVQLHGSETPALVADLRRAGHRVIKALFVGRPPGFDDAPLYPVDAILMEPGNGALPGGSGAAWGWAVPDGLRSGLPLVLAGGLHSGNVRDAIKTAQPDAVDVSSGVESAPGRKNPERVRAFLEAVRACPAHPTLRRIF